jgi:3-oxoacyl-[acyl-carrier-protein] synthase III
VRSRIVGTGRGIPEKVLTNKDLEKMVDTSDAWIVERTGIRERRVLDPSLATSDLATEAGLKACRAAGVDPSALDCIIVGTVTPDHPFPATATYVQRKLGARAGGAAFDVSAACAGFLYAMAAADGFIGRGMFKRVLIIGVEVLSRIVDWTDRNTCVLFGDGAGAALLVPEADERRGILSTHIFADGGYTDILNIPAGGTRAPLTPELMSDKKHLVKMNGREVYKHAVRNMSAAAAAALDANQLRAADVDWVFAHQANIRIIEGVSERVGIPMERFFLNIAKYGNTSSASLPIALDEALEQGELEQGDLLVLAALGGGLAWGSAVIRW